MLPAFVSIQKLHPDLSQLLVGKEPLVELELTPLLMGGEETGPSREAHWAWHFVTEREGRKHSVRPSCTLCSKWLSPGSVAGQPTAVQTSVTEPKLFRLHVFFLILVPSSALIATLKCAIRNSSYIINAVLYLFVLIVVKLSFYSPCPGSLQSIEKVH